MRICGRPLMRCGAITSLAILLSFLAIPAFGEQPMGRLESLSESGMKRYSDSEVDLLIDDLTGAALDAIEQAAGEAAKAAALAMLEREAAALREAARQLGEAQRWQLEAESSLKAIAAAKRAGVKNAVLAGAVCFIGGLAVGAGGIIALYK